jgi:uncharacterized membrane protein YjjP (DUF1212 family)
MEESQRILKVAVSIGETLLKSGSEIYRVQETIERVLQAYGIEDFNVYVLSNGIFATVHEERPDHCSMLRNVPLGGSHLGRIAQLNQLSREICNNEWSPQQAQERLAECQRMPSVHGWPRLLATGMGCTCFTFMVGGQFWEMVTAFLQGIMLQLFLSAAQRRNVSKFVIDIVGSALITVFSLLLVHFGANIKQDTVVIGSIVILLPGVALTTSIRDLFNGDYLSGGIRLMDALLTAICIATGVGGAIIIYQMLV